MQKLHNPFEMLRHRLPNNEPAYVEGEYTEAAVLVMVIEDSTEPALIMTQRASHMRLHPGEAAFPGGKRDPEDSSLIATGLREAEEEVGLDSGQFQLIGQLDQRLSITDIKMTPFVGIVPADIKLKANPCEIENIYTIPLSFLCDQSSLTVTDRVHKGQNYRVPHFDYQQHSVWGVTALILVDLMNTVFDAGLSLK